MLKISNRSPLFSFHRSFILALTASFGFVAAMCVSAQAGKTDKVLVIRNVSVIDGVSPTTRLNQTVVVSGGQITAIGPSETIRSPRGAKVINGQGKYLIPGLSRAEVMVSLRAATDKTHITQLLGRMIRSPLARRIPGNQRLNSVDCLLPFFNKKTVVEVVGLLTTGGELGEDMPGRRVLVNAREMGPNSAVPQEVWSVLTSLPSQSAPKQQAKPVKRLMSLAHELAFDKLLPTAGKDAEYKLHKTLDGLMTEYSDEISEHRKAVLEVEGKTLITNLGTKAMSFDDFVERADFAIIDEAYKKAGRVISADLARSYCNFLADKDPDADDKTEAIREARIKIAALGLVADIKERLEQTAENLANQWIDKYRVDFKVMNDDRREVYDEIIKESSSVAETALMRPKSELQASTTVREIDGTETQLPTFDKHLLCDTDGLFPAVINDWETTVVKTELARPNCVAWYRNPGRGSESLGIAYKADKSIKIMRPDFLFFVQDADGTVSAEIVDPHGIHLADALAKLQGLAEYAGRHAATFRRVDAVAVSDGVYRVLDMKEAAVRDAVLTATNAKALYQSEFARQYVTKG